MYVTLLILDHLGYLYVQLFKRLDIDDLGGEPCIISLPRRPAYRLV